MGEVSEVERREELKVVAEVALVQGHQGLGQGQSRAQSPDQGQGLARNLDPESPDQGQPADRDPGVDPRGLEVDPRGLDLDRPSQAAAQGLALAVRQGRGPREQQGQGPQAHQGRGQGLPEAIEINHQFKCTGYVLLLFVSCGLKCPYIIGLKSYFWLS